MFGLLEAAFGALLGGGVGEHRRLVGDSRHAAALQRGGPPPAQTRHALPQRPHLAGAPQRGYPQGMVIMGGSQMDCRNYQSRK